MHELRKYPYPDGYTIIIQRDKAMFGFEIRKGQKVVAKSKATHYSQDNAEDEAETWCDYHVS